MATDALVVGIDFPNVEDVIDLDCRPNHGKQCKGRAGRPGGEVRNPRGITYVTKATLDKAKPPLPAVRRSTQTPSLPSIPMVFRLTEKMIKVGTIRLHQFCQQLWEELHDEVDFLPPLAFLPNAHIKNILDNVACIQSPTDLSSYVNDLHLLSSHKARLFLIINELQDPFSSMQASSGRKKKLSFCIRAQSISLTGYCPDFSTSLFPSINPTNVIYQSSYSESDI